MQIDGIKKVFFKPLAKFNQWYDNLMEPKRFIMMLVFAVSPWLLMDIIGLATGHRGWEVFGLLWILIMILMRMWWIAGSLKKYL